MDERGDVLVGFMVEMQTFTAVNWREAVFERPVPH
jgi:hypothetical protein